MNKVTAVIIVLISTGSQASDVGYQIERQTAAINRLTAAVRGLDSTPVGDIDRPRQNWEWADESSYEEDYGNHMQGPTQGLLWSRDQMFKY